jgi:hypothetical protein
MIRWRAPTWGCVRHGRWHHEEKQKAKNNRMGADVRTVHAPQPVMVGFTDHERNPYKHFPDSAGASWQNEVDPSLAKQS